jgi:hypothetical protein
MHVNGAMSSTPDSGAWHGPPTWPKRHGCGHWYPAVDAVLVVVFKSVVVAFVVVEVVTVLH